MEYLQQQWWWTCSAALCWVNIAWQLVCRLLDRHVKIQEFLSLNSSEMALDCQKHTMNHIHPNVNTFFLVAHLRRLVRCSQSHIYMCRNCRWLYTIRRSHKANCYMEYLQHQWWWTEWTCLAALCRVNIAWYVICRLCKLLLYKWLLTDMVITGTRCICTDKLCSTI